MVTEKTMARKEPDKSSNYWDVSGRVFEQFRDSASDAKVYNEHGRGEDARGEWETCPSLVIQ